MSEESGMLHLDLSVKHLRVSQPVGEVIGLQRRQRGGQFSLGGIDASGRRRHAGRDPS